MIRCCPFLFFTFLDPATSFFFRIRRLDLFLSFGTLTLSHFLFDWPWGSASQDDFSLDLAPHRISLYRLWNPFIVNPASSGGCWAPPIFYQEQFISSSVPNLPQCFVSDKMMSIDHWSYPQFYEVSWDFVKFCGWFARNPYFLYLWLLWGLAAFRRTIWAFGFSNLSVTSFSLPLLHAFFAAFRSTFYGIISPLRLFSTLKFSGIRSVSQTSSSSAIFTICSDLQGDLNLYPYFCCC